MKRKEDLVLVGHRMCRGGVGLQWWWWRRIPFSSSRILPFELVSANSDWWALQRIEKEEI